MANFNLHSDESRYSACLLHDMEQLEKQIRAGAAVTNQLICHYYNVINEICRISQPILEQVFTIKNGDLCVE